MIFPQKLMLLLALIHNPVRSRKALKRMQNRKLRRLAHYACKNFPYYRDLFRISGITPRQIRSENDLRAIPITGKEELRKAIREIPSLPTRCQWLSTSGSSGIPMRFPVLPSEKARMNLSWLRPMLAHGVRPWHSRMEITGPHNIKKQDRWYQRVGLFQASQSSVFETEQQWLEALNRNRPDVLWGYSRSLIDFSRFLIDQGSPFHRPKWVFGVSELVDIQGREAIRSAFGRELIDLYGAVETGCIAWQCPACGDYHLNMDSLVVEFLQNREHPTSGQAATIVITNLHSRAFPLLRYAIGDCGIPSSKEPVCKRSLPLMSVIAGREDDTITLRSGRKLPPLFFFAVMKNISGLQQWRVMQEASKNIRISVVADPLASFSKIAAETYIRNCIKEPVDIIVETVSNIPPDPSGKQRSVIVHCIP